VVLVSEVMRHFVPVTSQSGAPRGTLNFLSRKKSAIDARAAKTVRAGVWLWMVQ